ncbi:butyrophilin-like protein 10 isoform X1 [Esox lucius]|uniref:butyrophilin-like protein 10 isoform X1 n=1 Tax=Esox lucius TaxID=8010 RepID=UPI0009732C0B|nr:butyrophilin-like protein 10 isoform X1 [Esox lucius]
MDFKGDRVCALVSMFFVVTSANVEEVLGVVGEPVLLCCFLSKLALPINSAKTRIMWQDREDKVLHVINKGQEVYDYQDPYYKNRTTFDSDHLASGNLSLLLNPVNILDNHMRTTVILIRNHRSEKVCTLSLNVAARYQKPTVNLTDSTVECNTQGGFPEGQVTWMTNNTPLDPGEADTKTSQDPETRTFNISSRVNGTGIQNLTCSIHNPTLNETQTTTISIRPITPYMAENSSNVLVIACAVGVSFILTIITVIICRRIRVPCCP